MPSSSPNISDKRYTILVSDDDPSVRRSLQLMLNGRGYHAKGYTSGCALIADPHALAADCLVVDYRMPDVDGLTVLNHLRCKGWCGKAILISGYHNKQLEKRARDLGFEEVISKPFIRRAVLDAVARFATEAAQEACPPNCGC